jgi:hypothetical protein
MGTSSPGSGAGGSNPLIPSWIPNLGPPGPQPSPPPQDPPDKPEPDTSPNKPDPQPLPPNTPPPNTNRFQQPRRDFNKFVRSKGQDSQAFRDAAKGYSKSANGNTRVLARRMQPSAARVVNFYNAISAVKNTGLNAALATFNLSSYTQGNALDILSALNDEIFKDQSSAFDNTQDDSITRQAYANTVTRICEIDGLDLNSLTNEQIQVMLAIFIEETIAQRIICDIGNGMTELTSDVDALLEIEDNAYQIINGLVRTEIMPEIIATQMGGKEDLEQKIENIYRIAFDALGGTNN